MGGSPLILRVIVDELECAIVRGKTQRGAREFGVVDRQRESKNQAGLVELKSSMQPQPNKTPTQSDATEVRMNNVTAAILRPNAATQPKSSLNNIRIFNT